MKDKKKKRFQMIPDSSVRHSASWRRVLIRSFFAALLAVFVLLLVAMPVSRFTNYLHKKLVNEDKVQTELGKKLQAYADSRGLSLSDIADVEDWEKDTHMRIRILGSTKELENQREYAEKYGSGIFSDALAQAYLEYPVLLTLADGEIWVSLQRNPFPWYTRANIVILFLLLIFVYAIGMLFLMQDEIEYMIYLRDEINIMSGGDLTHEIRGYGDTEIGQIGEGINELRKSIAGQIQKEHEALTANRELVTAMSHDLRTPLTRQIGYLEILHLKKYESEQQHDSYIQKARSNAFLMKETTDKLFRYFLAFGQSEQREKKVEADGRLLFNHALREQSDYLKSQQFTVTLSSITQPFSIRIDPDEFARVFDNIFQNIKKYGDLGKPVTIRHECGDGTLRLLIKNGIKEDTSKVESTRIGMKIVERIMKDMNGSMNVVSDGVFYEVQLQFTIQSA
ncbi:MAG: HAMP domain-containing histidine kinase [Lachnospiraceae bacterium]|nr:HAMP domain-containing histidine kinase [Lachnospiraceae bacterium]